MEAVNYSERLVSTYNSTGITTQRTNNSICPQHCHHYYIYKISLQLSVVTGYEADDRGSISGKGSDRISLSSTTELTPAMTWSLSHVEWVFEAFLLGNKTTGA